MFDPFPPIRQSCSVKDYRADATHSVAVGRTGGGVDPTPVCIKGDDTVLLGASLRRTRLPRQRWVCFGSQGTGLLGIGAGAH